jgi:AraC family carnitine catabolism transcriptional activator
MHVCLILFPGFQMLAYVVAREVFRIANQCAGQDLFTLEVRTVTGGPVAAFDGTQVSGQSPDWFGAQGFDLVLLCAGQDPFRLLPMGLRAFLSHADAAGATLGGVDGGGLVLAKLGFLTGREAVLPTTADQHQIEGFPQIALSQGPFSFDRQRLTTAGGLATGDALLAWIGRAHGPDLAARTADALAHGSIRETGERQRLARCADPLLNRMQAIMAAHMEQPLTVKRIAAELDLSTKQLRLRCQQTLGQTPSQIYQDLRMARAAQLISDTRLSVDNIARAAGFASPSAFTRSYRAQYGQSPQGQRRVPRSTADRVRLPGSARACPPGQ